MQDSSPSPASPSSAPAAALACLAGSWRRGWAALGPAALLLAATHILRGQALWLPVVLGALLWVIQAQTVCYRVALGRAAPALAGSRVTRDVPRLLLVWLLQTILIGVITALMLTLVGAVAYGVASVGPGFVASRPETWIGAMGPVGRPIAGAVALVGLAGVIWLKVRLALSPAATVDRQAVQVLSAWPLTRKRVLVTLAAMLAAGAPTLAMIALAPLLGVDGGLAGVLISLVAVGVTLPLNAGLMTYLYGRSPSD